MVFLAPCSLRAYIAVLTSWQHVWLSGSHCRTTGRTGAPCMWSSLSQGRGRQWSLWWRRCTEQPWRQRRDLCWKGHSYRAPSWTADCGNLTGRNPSICDSICGSRFPTRELHVDGYNRNPAWLNIAGVPRGSHWFMISAILCVCRDLSPSPWFCFTAVFIGRLCASWAFEKWLCCKKITYKTTVYTYVNGDMQKMTHLNSKNHERWHYLSSTLLV